MEIIDKHLKMFDNIIHIGAHLAQEADEWEKLSKFKVIWVEADPQTFLDLVVNINSRLRPEIHFPINAFATSKNRTKVNLYTYSNSGASNSIYKPGRRFKKYWPDIVLVGKKEITSTITLRQILEYFEIQGTNNLLVLDVQGHEWPIIGEEPELMSKFSYVICELTYQKVYRGQPSYKKIVKLMENQGFTLLNEKEQNHFDAHFARLV